MIVLALFAVLLAARQGVAGWSEEAATANASLSKGRVSEALSSYKTILTTTQTGKSGSAELWYDRGLAEIKSGDGVAASLSFRRALVLDPTLLPARRELSDDLANLGVHEPGGGSVARGLSMLHPEQIILGGSILGWIGVLLLVVLVMTGPRRKVPIALALTLAILGHGASVFGTMIDPRRIAVKEAVITAKEEQILRSTPADSGSSTGTLPPGSLITILSRNGAWWYVSGGPVPGAIKGWIPSNAVTPLLPPLSKGS